MTRRRGTPVVPTDRKQPPNKDRSNRADRSNTDRQAREHRSGEGADSALASLKSIERDRQKTQPPEDDSSEE
jgi:hypothetical protein